MSDDVALTVSTSRKSTLGDRIRHIASQLRQEDSVQIKATSRILGAAAQLAENHDRLIDEVVEMVEEDLERQPQPPATYTVEQLQQQFPKLEDAKTHFGIKASSWAKLAAKLNDQVALPTPKVAAKPNKVKLDKAKPSKAQSNTAEDAVSPRLEAIEHEMKIMRREINRIVALLEVIVEKI